MVEARSSHAAALLPDGKVLVTGGATGNYVYDAVASAELYDPSSGTWAATGNMIDGRISHTATLLPHGTVLVAGGAKGNYDALASAELYDPSSGTWTAAGKLEGGRAEHSATRLSDDTVLVAGGRTSGFDALASAELYEPGSGI